MGTKVLRPQNCLIERIRAPQATVIHRRGSLYNNNHYNSHLAKPRRSKPAPPPARSDHTKNATSALPAISRRFSSDDLRQSKNNHSHKDTHSNHRFVIAQVAILRRGELLDLKPRTETIGNRCRSLSPKHVAGAMPDMYAGSAISVSPSPKSLPLPSFSKRKQEVSVAVDDSATRDLRRLLRLD